MLLRRTNELVAPAAPEQGRGAQVDIRERRDEDNDDAQHGIFSHLLIAGPSIHRSNRHREATFLRPKK